jgi:tRNA(Arg) A34 adenosine deaminase TadA
MPAFPATDGTTYSAGRHVRRGVQRGASIQKAQKMSLDVVYGESRNRGAAKALAGLLHEIADEGTVYLGYPALATADERVEVDALLASQQHGLVAVLLADDLPTSAEEWAEVVAEQGRLYAVLESHLSRHEGLCVDRKLAVVPYTATVFASSPESPDVGAEEGFYGTMEELPVWMVNLDQIPEATVRSLQAAVQRVMTIKPAKKRAGVVKESSGGAILKVIEKGIANLDGRQKAAAIESLEGSQRICGLARFGKTVVLALKAAYPSGQSLVSLTIGTDGVRRDIVLPMCYRNIPWALALAHALDIGVYRASGGLDKVVLRSPYTSVSDERESSMGQGHHQSLNERAQEYWDARLSSLPPQSAEEYFALLLDRALRAQGAGDYGISAVLSVQCNGFEIASFGWNTIYSQRNPLGHAEANAIRGLSDLIALSPSAMNSSISPWTSVFDVLRSDANIFIRQINDPGCQSVLYTTLEPCPMCTVAIITAGVNSVVVAASDEFAGALASDRLNSLSPAWPKLAASQDLRVHSKNSDSSDVSKFISPELTSMLSEVFLANRESLDRQIEQGGVLSASTISRAVNGLAKKAKRSISEGL